MVIDFSKINLKKRPNFILRNFDGKAIGVLGHIIKPTAEFNYNEISEIEFEYPSYDNGVELEEYNYLSGMRIIDVEGFGQFILRNPEEKDDGIIKIKSCTAYSLEYEFNNKTITIEEGTYNFWSPFNSDNTIVQMILQRMPSWSIGTISTDLIGKYRTFNVDNKTIYDFIKNDLQETYECIFEFDTYNRTFNVRSVNDKIIREPVYLSTANLAKEIEIEENLDELVTALDVFGADGVDIRSVNPMGQTRIYNLDTYMTEEYFSPEMISKWENWKSTFESYQDPYYTMVMARNMLISKYSTQFVALNELKGELGTLESQKAAILQLIAIDSSAASQLIVINNKIKDKNAEIDTANRYLTQIQNEIDQTTQSLQQINRQTSFESFFTADEIKLLDRYFKCASLTDTTFVAADIDSYASDPIVAMNMSMIFNITNIGQIDVATYNANGAKFYTVRGGSISESSSDFSVSADIVRGTLQVNRDNTYVASFYLNTGTSNGTEFPSGTLSLMGSLRGSVVQGSTTLQFSTSSTTAYLSFEVSDYQKMSIEWELYEYGKEFLKKKSQPTYKFKVDSVNFFALDDFVSFARHFTLGQEIYLHLSMGVIAPIVIGMSVEFDDLSTLELDFGNDYHCVDSEFTLQDLLDDSVSMGNALDFNQYNYSNFVNSGAHNQIKEFMSSALDTMKNMLLSGENNEITIDQAGLRCRKFQPETNSYSPKQLWLAHNALMFSSDGFESAVIGIGEFVDRNLGSIYGIIAPAIVGTILAGNQLVIESDKKEGDVCVFRVDADGASLHNASFNLYNSTDGRIDLGADFGIVGGGNQSTLFYYNSAGTPTGVRTSKNRSISYISSLNSAEGETPNANFWIDMNGSAYFRGKLYAQSGEIGGFTIESSYLYSGSGTSRVALNGGSSYNSSYAIWAGSNTPSSAPFYVMKNGTLKATGCTISGTITSSDGEIGGLTIKSGYLCSGSGGNHVEINSSTSHYSEYAFWAGADNPASAPFWVKKNGQMSATDGIFEGTIDAKSIKTGTLSVDRVNYQPAYTYTDDAMGSIKLTVTNGDSSSTVEITGNKISAKSAKIEFTGYVEFKSGVNTKLDGLSDGSTIINGGCIKTGTIEAKYLNLSGAITWDDLETTYDWYGRPSGLRVDLEQVQSDVSTAKDDAKDAKDLVDDWSYEYLGKTYIDGSQIFTGTVTASKLGSGYVSLLNRSGNEIGNIGIDVTADGYGIEINSTNAGLRITARGNVWVQSAYGSFGIGTSDYAGIAFTCGANLIPQKSGLTVGISNDPWDAVYADTGEIITSDKNRKHDIERLPDKYITMIDNLEIVRYRLDDGTSNRFHVGFISQQVKEAMDAAEIDSTEFGGYVKDVDEKGNDIYMLRYEEFIAILLAKIKKQDERIALLEQTLNLQ